MQKRTEAPRSSVTKYEILERASIFRRPTSDRVLKHNQPNRVTCSKCAGANRWSCRFSVYIRYIISGRAHWLFAHELKVIVPVGCFVDYYSGRGVGVCVFKLHLKSCVHQPWMPLQRAVILAIGKRRGEKCVEIELFLWGKVLRLELIFLSGQCFQVL